MQNNDSPEDYLQQLAPELLFQILLPISDLSDLAAACLTSKTLAAVCQTDNFWQRKFFQDFGIQPKFADIGWKEAYQLRLTYLLHPPLSIGDQHAGIINNQGQLLMMGDNKNGQLGDDSLEPSSSWEVVKFNRLGQQPKVIQVSCGRQTTGAITEDGLIYVWGENTRRGSLGIGLLEADNIVRPFNIFQLKDQKAKQIDSGYGSTIVLMENGRVYAWGKLATGLYASQPVLLHDPETSTYFKDEIIQVATGYNFFAVLTNQGQIYAWGNNQFYPSLFPVSKIYELNEFNSNHAEFLKPVLLQFLEPVKQLSVGFNHFGLVTEKGDLYMIGLNYSSQIGGKSGAYNHLTQANLPGPVLYLNCRSNTTVVMIRGGRVFMWGDNSHGQITYESRNITQSSHRRVDWLITPELGKYPKQYDQPVEIQINKPDESGPDQILYLISGGNFSIAITEDQIINIWGRHYY